MKQEPADKFMGRDHQCFNRIVFRSVSVLKANLTIINRFDSVVRYGNTMRISAKILKDLFGTGKGTFGIGQPFDHKKRPDKAIKLLFASVFFKLTRQR